jgi:hypothetical protein
MHSWIESGRKNIIELTTPTYGEQSDMSRRSVLNTLDAGHASWVHKNLDRFFIKVTFNHHLQFKLTTAGPITSVRHGSVFYSIRTPIVSSRLAKRCWSAV